MNEVSGIIRDGGACGGDMRDKASLERRTGSVSRLVYDSKGAHAYIKYRQARKEARPLRKNCKAEIRLKMQI